MIRKTGRDVKLNRNLSALRSLNALGYETQTVRRALLKLVSVSHGEMAEMLQISRQTVTAHLYGRRTNPVVQRAIAEALGVPRDELFATTESEDEDVRAA